MAVVIDEKGTTSSEVVGQLIVELQSNQDSGASSGVHSGSNEELVKFEANTPKKLGAIIGVYDPEVNAIFGGLL